MKWRWGWGWVAIVHERGWYPQNKTSNHIISNKLFIFCATFTFISFNLNFFTIHVHLTLIIALLTIAEFWTVKSSSDRAAFIYLFIYLFIHLSIYLFALGWNTFVAYCLQNVVRCDFYSSWKHGRSQWLFALISLPAIFTWIQLEWINYYTVFPHDCNIKW